MSKKQIGVLSCSGEECLGGTLSRMATRKVMEQNPETVVTLCLPLYIAGGEEERNFARDYPVISVDGCRECCAKRATIKFSGAVADTVVLSDILGEETVHEKIMSMRDLTEEHARMAERVAAAIAEKLSPLVEEPEDALPAKQLGVDFLYLDLNTCQRCKATDSALEEALSALSGVLDLLGYTVNVNKINVTTKELARQHRFESSPTIRVNGVDICGEVQESNCGDCGDLCGDSVDCRVFVYEGKEYEQPPAAMIADGILQVLYGALAEDEKSYALPDNLRSFFAGAEQSQEKETRAGSGGGCGCAGGTCC